MSEKNKSRIDLLLELVKGFRREKVKSVTKVEIDEVQRQILISSI